MTREWKPGDVAICTGEGDRVVRTEDGKWHHPGYKYPQTIRAVAIRPLVVIDPEDADAVERLADALTDVLIDTPGGGCMRPNTVHAALRKFANPTPPRMVEPALWGVVKASCVHNASRLHWMLHEDGNWWPFAPYGEDDRRPMPDDWDSLIDPVLVREGVTS